METRLFNNGDDEGIVLPPGFRFHPTDEELITHYLSRKVLESSFCTKAIGEADLNKVEPWDLPRIAKMGEREFYFFCMRDRKYPTGMRTNRATDAGYWKATGKDKEIFRGKILVGMKKTLVFYKGRAPKGEKTNWVMHEFRLEGQNNSPTTAKNEWVICRIFLKSSDGKKVHISNMERMRRYENNSNLPPLIECSGYDQQTRPAPVDHVAYFSDPTKENKLQEEMVGNFKENKPREEMVCNFNNSFMFPKYSVSDPIAPFPIMPNLESWQYASGMGPDQFMMNLKADLTPEGETKTGFDLVSSGHEIGRMTDYLNISSGPVDLGCFWI